MKQLEEIETMVDDAVERKEHQQIKKTRHGQKRHEGSRLKIKLAEMVADPKDSE